MSCVIHQEVDLNVSPQRVYVALTNSDQFSEFSGQPAEIESVPGGSFKCFNEQIVGRIIELVPNQRVVQAWRVAMWPEGIYSIVKFELRENGAGTRLILDHTGYPEEYHAHLEPGWTKMYLDPVKKYFEQSS